MLLTLIGILSKGIAIKKTLIGNHIWIAIGATVLKGRVISDDNIVVYNVVESSINYHIRVILPDFQEQVAPILFANK